MRVGLRREPSLREQRLHRRRLPVDERLPGRTPVQHRDVHVRSLRQRRRVRGRVRLGAPLRERKLHPRHLPHALPVQRRRGLRREQLHVPDVRERRRVRRQLRRQPPVRSRRVHPRPVPDVARMPERRVVRRAQPHLLVLRLSCRVRRRLRHEPPLRQRRLRLRDVPVDRGLRRRAICNTTTRMCQACGTDAACVTAYGPQHLCVNNVCLPGQCRVSSDCAGGQICDAPTRTCNACGSDTVCSVDPSYGSSTVCIGGGCVPGDCHGSSGDCPTGQLCGISAARHLRRLLTDAQCAADPTYGAGHICFQGICQPGNCHGTSGDCSGALSGYVCGAQSANTCGPCATDSQCQADQTYGSATICNTTTGQSESGECVSAACSTQRSVRRQCRRLLLRRPVHAGQLLRRRRLRAAGLGLPLPEQQLHRLRGRDGQQVLRRSAERQRRDGHRQRHRGRRRQPELQLPHGHARAAGRRRVRARRHANHRSSARAGRRCRSTGSEVLPIIVPGELTIVTPERADSREPAGEHRSQHGQRRRLPARRRSRRPSRPIRPRPSPSTERTPLRHRHRCLARPRQGDRRFPLRDRAEHGRARDRGLQRHAVDRAGRQRQRGGHGGQAPRRPAQRRGRAGEHHGRHAVRRRPASTTTPSTAST